MIFSSILMAILGGLMGLAMTRMLASLDQIVLEEKGLWSVIQEKRSLCGLKDYGIVSVFVLFVLAANWFLPFGFELAFALIAGFLLIGCFLTDLQEGLLLDSFTQSLVWLGLIASLVPLTVSSQEAIMGAVLGYGIFWLFNVLYRYVRGTEGMYPGDFKLNAGLGACLGWKLIIPVLLASLLLLILVAGMAFIFSKRSEWKDWREKEIPYGCFCSIAGGFSLIARLI